MRSTEAHAVVMRTPRTGWPFALRRRRSASSSDAKSVSGAPPSPPPPPPVEGGGDKEVKRALARIPGRPHRIPILIAALLAAGGPVAPALADKVAMTLVADIALLRALVDLIVEHNNTMTSDPVPPRERLRLPWAAASFIVAGPPILRKKIVNDVALLKKLATVFTNVCFDASRAAIVAQVLYAALADAPRAAAAALAEDRMFVKACVRNIAHNPAAELLPRLVGTKVFAFNDPGAIVPAHKRSIAALAKCNLQDQLAEYFVQAARKDTAVCAAVAAGMAEVSARTMALPKMFEDPDERGDGYAFGMTHLSIVSAHVYNDAVDALYLGTTCAPLLQVLDTAIEMQYCEDVFVPAFELLSKLLRSLVRARSSVLPLVRTAARERSIAALEEALLKRMNLIVPLLSGKGQSTKRLGRRRLAVVDAVLALLSAGRPETINALLERHGLLKALIELMAAFPESSVLHTRVSEAIVPLLSSEESAVLAVRTSGILVFFNDHTNDSQLLAQHSSTLMALHKLSTSTDVLESIPESRVFTDAAAFRAKFAPVVAKAKEQESRGLYREYTTARVKLEDKLDLHNIAKHMTPSEDRGKLLYATSAAHEATRGRPGLSDLGEFFGHGGHMMEFAHSAFEALKMNVEQQH